MPGPGTFDLRKLRTVAFASGQAFYTTYRRTYWPALFNPGAGDTRFAPFRGQDGAWVPTLYGAPTKTVALLESVFHEIQPVGARVISTAIDLYPRGLIEVRHTAILRFIDLTDAALVRLGLTGPGGVAARDRLVAAPPEHYPCTREWAARLHARGRVGGHLPAGIMWQSRVAELAAAGSVLLDDLLTGETSRAFVLFGDRVPTALASYMTGEHYEDLSQGGAAGLVAAVAEQLDATVE